LDDKEEFVAWWQHVRPQLVRVLRYYTNLLGSDVAADLEQDLAYIAWKGRDRFSDLEYFRRWVIQQARWRALDKLRANKKIMGVLSEWQESKRSTIERNVEGSASLYEILHAVDNLPPQQRLVIRGTMEGKPEKQLARELNVTEATIRSLRRFGRLKLQLILEEGVKQ
jgi:RNA polymerase sigma factor (sigma-70 family)